MKNGLLVRILRPFVLLFRPCTVSGAEVLQRDGGAILCANHLSGWDPVLLTVCQPIRICFMAKEELFRFKPLGAVLKALGAFSVARGTGDTGALEAARDVVRRGEIMGIFPEGTRSRSGKLLRFRSGAALIAADTAAAVIPCGITRKSKLFRRIAIRFGDPITPEELHLTGEKPDLRYAARLLRERVQALSGQEYA